MPRLTVNQWYTGLSERQRRFCEAFSGNGGNAVAAAKAAGYKKPHPEGVRLLQTATISTALEALRMETTNAAIATREERQMFWTTELRNLEQDITARLRASELLGKCQGDFIERVDATTHIIIDHRHAGIM